MSTVNNEGKSPVSAQLFIQTVRPRGYFKAPQFPSVVSGVIYLPANMIS